MANAELDDRLEELQRDRNRTLATLAGMTEGVIAVDRHEHIGRGEIGLDAFRSVFQDPMLGKLPGYLETEKGTDDESGEDWDVINLRVLRELI